MGYYGLVEFCVCFRGPGRYRKNPWRALCGDMPRAYRRSRVRSERRQDRQLVWRLSHGVRDPEDLPSRLNHRHSALWHYL